MECADGKGSSSASELGSSKKIEAGEMSSSKRADSKNSIDDDIKNVYEKGNNHVRFSFANGENGI
jgi:hypothetical protein